MKEVFICAIIFAFTALGPYDAEASDCSFIKGLESPQGISCGSIEVPENHDNPDGRKIRIVYAVIKAKNAGKSEDPVIYFSGGPGGSSLRAGFVSFFKNVPLAETRDLILFDQRGINHSTSLPDIGPDIYRVMARDADIKTEQKMIGEVLKKYRGIAQSKGIELGDYNSFQNARDVGVLMKTLGYNKYNLFGVSYGTRLARLLEDMYPEKVKTVILDSPNLMTEDFLIDRLRSYSNAAEKIFRFCETDKDCSTKYPDLRDDYKGVINTLKQKPIAIDIDGEVFYLNSQDAMFFLRHRLYRNNAKEVFPEFITALKNRDIDKIRPAVASEKADVSDGGFNSSMFLAVSAYESMDEQNTRDVIAKVYGALPNFPEQLGFFTGLYLEGMNWHDKRLPMSQREFKNSGVPTMIFVNQYDPVTPPENGPIFKKRLSNSHLFIIDQGGHGGGDFRCKMKVMISLMDNPEATPDSSCLKLFGK